MRLAALALLLAGPALAQDGGAPWDALDVHRAVIDVQLPDGGAGVRVVMVGGCWLNASACQGMTAELESKRARVAHLEEHAGDVPYQRLVQAGTLGSTVSAIATAIAVGAAACTMGDCFGLRRR